METKMQAAEIMASAPSWEPAALEGCKCTRCGRHFFPKRSVCTECGSTNAMLGAPIEGPGTLYSYSVIHIAPKVFEVPYAVGYVDLPGDVRVLGQIANWKEVPLLQGMRVEVGRGQIATEADGSPRVSFVFRAVAR